MILYVFLYIFIFCVVCEGAPLRSMNVLAEMSDGVRTGEEGREEKRGEGKGWHRKERKGKESGLPSSPFLSPPPLPSSPLRTGLPGIVPHSTADVITPARGKGKRRSSPCSPGDDISGVVKNSAWETTGVMR